MKLFDKSYPVRFFASIVISIVSTLISSCSNSAGSDNSGGLGGTHFYSLSSLAQSTDNKSALKIGVGPIEIPRLLNRPQIVARKNETEIIISEVNQWGGSFKEDLLQTLIDNLSTLKKTDNVEQYPWKFSYKPDYQIKINFERFDGELGKNIILKARWRLLKNNREVIVRRTRITTPILGDKSYKSYVKAQTKALILLSKKIASYIKS